ncbi:acyl carrier protein [Kineosporia succinea]|uniref:Acyl carrier protein n=1 Tax=Kineosporia succinea TaxID=84632 RepID=A0ABT9P7N2_9ACTN|nr:acyl carrier protein [Kineosporia succinea]MDP9828419.1 acyl carrier protein [Kineosporia succinea]
MSTEDLYRTVRRIVVEELEIEPEELDEAARFEDDYDADSLALLAMVARFENEAGILVPNERIAEMSTFGQVLAVIGTLGVPAHA